MPDKHPFAWTDEQERALAETRATVNAFSLAERPDELIVPAATFDLIESAFANVPHYEPLRAEDGEIIYEEYPEEKRESRRRWPVPDLSKPYTNGSMLFMREGETRTHLVFKGLVLLRGDA